MADDLRVRVDGVPSDQGRDTNRSTWLMVAAAFVIGLGIGVLIVPETADPATGEAVAGDLETPQEPVAPNQLETEGIAAIVEEFPDALVAVGSDSGSGLAHLLWPVAGPMVERSMDTGDNVKFDVATTYIAHTSTVPGLDGWVLSVGRFNLLQPLVAGVTSFEWHDSRSGRLAYTTEEEDGTMLWVVGADLSPEPVAIEFDEELLLGAWGDWGWALETERNETLLLNPEGEMRGRLRGVPLASSPDGWILVGSEGYQLVSAGGGVDGLSGQPDVGFLSAAVFSPDGEKVAIAGSSRVAVMDLSADGEATALPGPGSRWVAWSTDSRFVIVSGQSGVRIHDLDEGVTEDLLQRYVVVAGGVIPISRP